MLQSYKILHLIYMIPFILYTIDIQDHSAGGGLPAGIIPSFCTFAVENAMKL